MGSEGDLLAGKNAKYRLIIFDLDGTLADTYLWFVGVFNEVADSFGFRRVEKQELEHIRGEDVSILLKRFGIPKRKMPRIVMHVRKLMVRDAHQVSLFGGVDSLLQCLSNEGIKLGIVSSNSLDNVHQILGAKNAALIGHYQCGMSIFGKHVALRKVLRKSGALPSDSIYVGDEIRDIKAARKARVSAGSVSWGYNSAESLKAHSPDELFASMDDIVKRIIRE